MTNPDLEALVVMQVRITRLELLDQIERTIAAIRYPMSDRDIGYNRAIKDVKTILTYLKAKA